MQRKRYNYLFENKDSTTKYRLISSEALKLYFIVAQSLVTCLKPDYAVPKRSTDYCERLPEWKVENCQRQCQDYSGTNMLGDPKPCVQFTFHNMTDEMNRIEYECCLYTTLTSTLEYKNGTISGPMRCGTLFKFDLILQFISICESEFLVILTNDNQNLSIL